MASACARGCSLVAEICLRAGYLEKLVEEDINNSKLRLKSFTCESQLLQYYIEASLLKNKNKKAYTQGKPYFIKHLKQPYTLGLDFN